MNANQAICYTSHADKRRRFGRETAKAILSGARESARTQTDTLAHWLDSNGVLYLRDGTLEQLAALHNAARAGRYLPTRPAHCDITRDIGQTLREGGDCDQWAMVLLACCKALGFGAKLVAGGDAQDPYRHVWVQARAAGRWWDLDPKGSQEGLDFGLSAPFANLETWAL